MMNKTEQRFEAAKAAMHGLLSNSAMDVHNQLGSPYVALWAIEYADALLAELARTEPTTEKSPLAPDADGWVVRIPTDPIPEKHNGVRFADGWECYNDLSVWTKEAWEHKKQPSQRDLHITHYRPA
jgi:hypothetical protein